MSKKSIIVAVLILMLSSAAGAALFLNDSQISTGTSVQTSGSFTLESSVSEPFAAAPQTSGSFSLDSGGVVVTPPSTLPVELDHFVVE